MGHTGQGSNQSVRMQLTLWFGGVVVLMFFCVALYVGRMITIEVRKSVADHQYMAAQSAASLLSARIQERFYDIDLVRRTLGQSSQPLNGSYARLALARLQTVNNEFAWIGVTDTQGVVVHATSDLLVGENVAQRPWFAHGSKDMYVGDLHEALLLTKLLNKSRAGNHPLRFFDIAGPILDDSGTFKGVLSAHLHWSWVTSVVKSVLDQKASRSTMELIIAADDGSILYPESQLGVQLPVTLDLNRRDQIIAWSGGERYLVSSAAMKLPKPMTPLGWHIIVREPLGAATEVVRTIQWNLMAFGVFAVVVFVGLAYWISRRLSRPIEALAGVARSIEAGIPGPVVPNDNGPREIVSLQGAFKSMTDTLLRRERELALLNSDLERQVADRTQRLQQANDELLRISNSDGLTGLHNRRYIDERLQAAHAQAERGGPGYGVVLVDADRFKLINDQYGHLVGDDVLKALARILSEQTRASDVVARDGGEEFLVLVPALSTNDDLAGLGEKIRCAAHAVEVVAGKHLTVSVGVTHYLPGDASVFQVIERADQALYRAKQGGRDQVQVQV